MKFESILLRPPPLNVKSNKKTKPAKSKTIKKEPKEKTRLSTFESESSSNSDDMREFADEFMETTDANLSKSMRVKETVQPMTFQNKFDNKVDKENQVCEKAPKMMDSMKQRVLKETGISFLQQKQNINV